ncbi:MAG: hypothetical protein QXU47_00335 [Candidatus Bathyarchaeia archaeon]
MHRILRAYLRRPEPDYTTKLKTAAVSAQLASRASKVITEIQLEDIERRIKEIEEVGDTLENP